MGKLKIDFTIKERDKKLLMALLAVLIFACAYFFGYQKLMEKADLYESQASVLEAKVKDLTNKTNDKAKYTEDAISYKENYNIICANYANGTSQDASLDFLIKTQMITGSWIKSATISDSSLIYTFGKITSTNPAAAGAKVYNTDMKGYKTTLTLTYEATYSQWKSLINFINNYYSKNTIDSISMSYNDVTKVVSGTMTLSTYAITGSQRKFTPPVYNIEKGTDNIFASEVFNSASVKKVDDNGEYILSDYDYFVMLNASTADIDSCIIGKKEDVTKDSILSSNSNAIEDVTVRFSGSGDNYTVQYKIGNVTYPAKNYDKGNAFTPGNTLDMLLMSSARLSTSDKSGINLTIVNDSDKTLNLKVCNDDTTNPRVKIVSKTGSISIFK